MALTLGEISQGKGLPTFTLVLRDPMLLCSVVPARGPVLPADAYFRRQIDIEGDLDGALALKGPRGRLPLQGPELMIRLQLSPAATSMRRDASKRPVAAVSNWPGLPVRGRTRKPSPAVKPV